MSATVYAPPESVHVPDFNEAFDNGHFSMEKYTDVNNKFLDDLRAWLKANNYGGRLSGEVVRWSRADGYAQYMVAKLRPLTLIHLPIGDAWTMDAVFLRGLTANDVIAAVGSAKRMSELFGRPQ